jgi:hypothetical protein
MASWTTTGTMNDSKTCQDASRRQTADSMATPRAGPSRYPIRSPLENITSFFSRAPSAVAPPPVTPPPTPHSEESYSPLVSWLPASTRSTLHELTTSHVGVGVLSAVGATTLTVGSLAVYRRYFRRIRTAEYVTQSMLDKKRWIKGVVTRWEQRYSTVSLVECSSIDRWYRCTEA